MINPLCLTCVVVFQRVLWGPVAGFGVCHVQDGQASGRRGSLPALQRHPGPGQRRLRQAALERCVKYCVVESSTVYSRGGGGQMAEQLGNQAINQKVAGLIPGQVKCPWARHFTLLRDLLLLLVSGN